jgi:hypothetical protein
VSDEQSGTMPSRRELRVAETGPIAVFDGPPLTRRERKMREEMIATGMIPVQAPPVSSPAPEQPVREAATVESAIGADTTVTLAPPAPSHEPPRPLTRRELREQLRGKAPLQEPVEHSPIAVEPVAPVVERPLEDVIARTEVVDEAETPMTWPVLDAPSVPVALPDIHQVAPAVEQADDKPVPDVAAPPAVPLPPGFAPIKSADTATAPALEVGPAAPATHALILPVAPSIEVTGPLGDTGEIIVTGSIPLPRLIAETGLTGVVDSDIDDDDYSDYVDPDSGTYTQPIRAMDAVSSRSLEIDQPLIQKPRWGSLAITLGVSAAILGVTAISLLALALFTNVFAL